MLQPFATVESPGKNNTADSPVCEHSDPDAHRTKTHDSDQKYTEAESACPHRTAGCDHGKFHISCRTEPIPRNKCHGPYKRFHDRDPHHHMETHICTFFFHASKDRDWFCQCKYDQAACQYYDFCNYAELLYVVDCLVFSSCAETLTDNRCLLYTSPSPRDCS